LFFDRVFKPLPFLGFHLKVFQSPFGFLVGFRVAILVLGPLGVRFSSLFELFLDGFQVAKQDQNRNPSPNKEVKHKHPAKKSENQKIFSGGRTAGRTDGRPGGRVLSFLL
jgi:hypothetical protein